MAVSSTESVSSVPLPVAVKAPKDSIKTWLAQTIFMLKTHNLALLGTWLVMIVTMAVVWQTPIDSSIFLVIFLLPAWLGAMMVFLNNLHSQGRLEPGTVVTMLKKRIFPLLILGFIDLVFILALSLLMLGVSQFIKQLAAGQVTDQIRLIAIIANFSYNFLAAVFILVTCFATRLVSLDQVGIFRALGKGFSGLFKNIFRILGLLLIVTLLGAIAASPLILQAVSGQPIPMAPIAAGIGGFVVGLIGVMLIYFCTGSIFGPKNSH